MWKWWVGFFFSERSSWKAFLSYVLWDIYHINWCRISSINSMDPIIWNKMCWIWKSVSSLKFCWWKSNFRIFQAIQAWGGERSHPACQATSSNRFFPPCLWLDDGKSFFDTMRLKSIVIHKLSLHWGSNLAAFNYRLINLPRLPEQTWYTGCFYRRVMLNKKCVV